MTNSARTRTAALLLVAAALAACGGGVDTKSASPATRPAPTATTPATTGPPPAAPTTVAPSPSPSPPPPVAVDTSTVVWPWAASETRYDAPEAAAAGFAADLLGFDSPLVGSFRAGDTMSGEVDIRPMADGPATTVMVRRLEDGHWWVLGSTTGAIQLDPPGAAAIGSPLRLTGLANAFEGHVDVKVVQDGSAQPLGRGFVTGCMGDLCPFDGEVAFSTPTAGAGAVVLATVGGEDNRIWEATVARIAFTAGAPASVAPCTAEAIDPVVRQALAADGGDTTFVSVEVSDCRAGYARVLTVPDEAACGAGGPCLESEQVFLTDDAGTWRVVTYGTGISCSDEDLSAELLAACQGLALR